MSYSCQILADSLSVHGDRLTTMKIVFPRFILAEAKTHRIISGLGEQVEITQSLGINDEFDFSRNSASSRAIPFKRMVEMVKEHPFIPIAFQKDHTGMQGTEYMDERGHEVAVSAWLVARNKAIEQAEYLNQYGATKQLCNRLLEPFMWHTVVVTATEWENFFKLRCPQYTFGSDTNAPKVWKSKKDAIKDFPDWSSRNDLFWRSINKSQAEIHIQAIAELMWDAYNESKPKLLQAGEWHIPYGDKIDLEVSKWTFLNIDLFYKDMTAEMIKVATARCARISYETLGANPKIDYNADIAMHDSLLENGHESPLEHCGKAPRPIDDISSWEDGVTHVDQYGNYWSGNFKGWIQYRQLAKK